MRYALAAFALVLCSAFVVFLRKHRGLLWEFWLFLKAEKAWWIAPVVIALLLIAALLVAGQAAPYLPLIYTVF